MRLDGKVCIITGAASGMGLAMAQRFTREGARVIAADWNAERLAAAVADVQAAGGEITASQGDISDRGVAEGLTDLALQTYGQLDVLVNNAGIMDHMAAVGEMTDEIFERVMGVNLKGPVYATRRAVRHMLEHGGGSVVNVGSTASVSGGAAGAAYTMSKHALLGLTRNTAWQYAQRGVRCNIILPGGTATNIAETMPQDQLDPTGAGRAGAFAALIPGYLQPGDIANLALFLASDESKMINGAIIAADGGWTAL